MEEKNIATDSKDLEGVSSALTQLDYSFYITHKLDITSDPNYTAFNILANKAKEKSLSVEEVETLSRAWEDLNVRYCNFHKTDDVMESPYYRFIDKVISGMKNSIETKVER